MKPYEGFVISGDGKTFRRTQYLGHNVITIVDFLFSLHFLHHLFPCALWADYVFAVLDEPLANHGLVADVADEALVVPGEGLEGHKLGAAQSALACNGFGAGSTSFGE